MSLSCDVSEDLVDELGMDMGDDMSFYYGLCELFDFQEDFCGIDVFRCGFNDIGVFRCGFYDVLVDRC